MISNSTFLKKNFVKRSPLFQPKIQHLKKYLFAFMLFVFIGFSAKAQIWLNPITTGRPIATNYLGDKLSLTWYFNFEIGQSPWNASDVGIGQNTDGTTDWSWATAGWYADGTGSNKLVRRNIGNFQFTATGAWYAVGRAKINSEDAWTYADEGGWSNETTLTANTTLKACPYFTVSALGDPVSCTVSITGTTATLGWTKFTGSNTYNVMIVRYAKNATPTAPNNTTAYALNATLGIGGGTGTVIYATNNGISTLDTVAAETDYDYYFYSENWSYYSAGQKITALAPTTTWTTAWSNGAPTASVDAIIAGDYSVAANITAKTLTVNNNAIVTIPSGNNVTVTGAVAVTAPATLNLSNNANLIQVNNVANTGAINVNRESSPLFRSDYTMWSSPVSGTQTLGGFSPLTSLTPTIRFYIYDYSLGAGTGLYSSISPTTTFTTGTGYLIRMPNTWVDFVPLPGTPAIPASWAGVFTGVPNNGTVTINSLASNEYYAVGNPYPSTLSMDSFITGNLTNISGPLYFWRKTNDAANTTSYSTCTTAGCSINNGHLYPNTDFISVGQGFIVQTASSGTLNFTNTMRVDNNQNQFFRTKQIEKNRIWLNLTNDTAPVNQMLLAYMTGATQGIDPAIDGRYINDSQTALNSFLNNEEFAIQGRALPFDGTDTVPLAFKTTTDGNFTIAIDHVDGLFSGSQDIYLVDSKTGTETNLKTNSYQFTATAGVDNSRFTLTFQKTLSLDPQALNDNSVIVYKNNGVIYVNSGDKMMNNIKVFDIQGRLIAERNNVKANTTSIQNLKASNQVLIVQVTNEDNQVISKKVEN
jgi:hypothetical protein